MEAAAPIGDGFVGSIAPFAMSTAQMPQGGHILQGSDEGRPQVTGSSLASGSQPEVSNAHIHGQKCKQKDGASHQDHQITAYDQVEGTWSCMYCGQVRFLQEQQRTKSGTKAPERLPAQLSGRYVGTVAPLRLARHSPARIDS